MWPWLKIIFSVCVREKCVGFYFGGCSQGKKAYCLSVDVFNDCPVWRRLPLQQDTPWPWEERHSLWSICGRTATCPPRRPLRSTSRRRWKKQKRGFLRKWRRPRIAFLKGWKKPRKSLTRDCKRPKIKCLFVRKLSRSPSFFFFSSWVDLWKASLKKKKLTESYRTLHYKDWIRCLDEISSQTTQTNNCN